MSDLDDLRAEATRELMTEECDALHEQPQEGCPICEDKAQIALEDALNEATVGDTVTVDGVEWTLEDRSEAGEILWAAHRTEVTVDNQPAGGGWGWIIWGHTLGTRDEPPDAYEVAEGTERTADSAMRAGIAKYNELMEEQRRDEEALDLYFAEMERMERERDEEWRREQGTI